MKKYLLIPLIIIFLNSCHKLKEGKVTLKWYEPERTYLVFIPVHVGKSTIYMPYYMKDNEDYCVEIKGTYKGEIRTETIYLPKSQYECLRNGDTFTVGKDCSYSDDNNVKTKK